MWAGLKTLLVSGGFTFFTERIRKLEVRDLITVIEAVRYDYDRRRVGRLLILNGLNGGEGGGH